MGEDLKNTAGNKEFKAGPRIGQADGDTSRVPNGVGKDPCGACFIGVVFGHLGGVKPVAIIG